MSFLIPNQATSKHIAQERYCSASSSEIWSNKYDPDYFYHITDIHVTHYLPSTLNNFEKSLQIGSAYKANTVLITGDLVDNFNMPHFPRQMREARQIKEDWLSYFTIAQKYRKNFIKIIESFGNHDIPRILSEESDDFYYKNYSMISQWHNNFISPNDPYDAFTDKIGNFTFAVLNPVFFPIPPLPFDYYIHAPNEYIEKVENIIDSIPYNESVILATHYQGPVWSKWYSLFKKSISTKRFFDSILQKQKVKILITGHNHGSKRMVMHHGDSFEICASDLRYNLKAGIVTNDNENIVYHWFSINEPTQSFVTFPVPIDQTTSRTQCAVNKVRVISFDTNLTSKKKDFNDMYVEIDGLKIKLNPVRKLNKQNAWLLEADSSRISKGKHHLKLIGEKEEEFDFLFGQSSKINSSEELLYDDMLWANTQWIGLIILFIIFFFATFPSSNCSFDGYWKWTNKTDDNQENPSNKVKFWLISIFLGPIGIRSRLMRLPYHLRVLLFASVIISLFVPLFTFEVGGRYGFMFPFGYFLGQGNGIRTAGNGANYISHIYGSFELRYEEWCPFIAFLFFICAIVPSITAASSLGLNPLEKKESLLQLFDLLVVIGGFFGGLRLSLHSFMLLCERKCAFWSPFISFPILWLIILFESYFEKKKQREIKNK